MHLKSSEIAIQETNPASASGRVEGRPILESRKWLFARIDCGSPDMCRRFVANVPNIQHSWSDDHGS